jgi:transcriptional regulator with XRE-family HTH domain
MSDEGQKRPLGTRLFGERVRHRLTLTQAATKAGLSKGHLCKLENDPQALEGMTIATARKLAAAFGTTLHEFLTTVVR